MKTSATRSEIVQVYVACIALFIALAACGYYWVRSTAPVAHPAPIAHGFVTDMTYIDLPRMTVSLGAGGSTQVRVEISLEVARKDVAIVEKYQPQITDRLNRFFSKVSPDEIEEPNSLTLLRDDLLWQVNGTGMPVPVHDLMLKQMIVM